MTAADARQPHRVIAEAPPAPTTSPSGRRVAGFYSATWEQLTARPDYWPRRATDRPAAPPPFRLDRT